MKKIILSILAIFFILFGIINTPAREISEVPHWQTSPIKVYVPSDDNKAPSMRRAFAKWQAKSYGNLKFKFVAKGPADINVAFVEMASGSTPISNTSITYNGNSITKADIMIATKSKDFKKYSNDYVYTAMLHEVGRAIGMPVNPRKRTSIMYTPLSVQQDIMKFDIMKLYSVYGWSYANKNTQNVNSKPTEEKVTPADKSKTPKTSNTKKPAEEVKNPATNIPKTAKETVNQTNNSVNPKTDTQIQNIKKPDLDELGK